MDEPGSSPTGRKDVYESPVVDVTGISLLELLSSGDPQLAESLLRLIDDAVNGGYAAPGWGNYIG
jgi:hypothetical protein